MSANAENTSPSSSALAVHIPDEVIAGAPPNVIVEGGDWICGDNECKNINFGRRTQCNKCHRERSVEKSNSSGGGLAKKKLGTEIGKAAAEKSRGLFSAEDWQCSKCANVNWARRQTCNMCNAPKFCDVEERTGYGGGYNDRGIVEYKDRSESDSDYDEFGRLKKRTIKKSDGRNNSDINIEERELAREYGDEDEDEDEEDDEEDGDGDLSKYDLWGDDEVVNASKNTPKEKNLNTFANSPNSQPKQSSSSSSSSSASKSSSHSRSRTTSSSSSSSATSKSNGQVKKRRKEKGSSSRSRSRNRSREVSKSHSVTSPKKSNRKLSKSRSRSRSSSKSDRRRMAHQANSHSSPSLSRGRNSKTRHLKSKSRSRSPRSRSHSRTRHVAKTLKCKRSNSSRSPESELPAASSRYRRRSRSRSLSASKRRR